MNKFLTVTSVLLLVVSGMLGYEVYKLRNQQTPPDKSKLIDKCPPLLYDYSKTDPEGIINYETAKALVNNYDKSKKGIIVYNDTVGAYQPGEDSRSIWFSLEKLKNFIWHIEKQNCENGCVDSLGLRIYFARYPNLVGEGVAAQKGLGLVPENYSNRLTLFMVPTYKNAGTGVHYDFSPLKKNCKETAPRGEEFGFGPLPFILLFDMSGSTGGDSQNHGGLIPPGTSTGTSF